MSATPTCLKTEGIRASRKSVSDSTATATSDGTEDGQWWSVHD